MTVVFGVAIEQKMHLGLLFKKISVFKDATMN